MKIFSNLLTTEEEYIAVSKTKDGRHSLAF